MTRMVSVERQALTAIRQLEVRFAYPTLILALVLLVSYVAVIASTLGDILPPWIALIINSFVAYAAYTPLHEASHGNVAHGRLAWLNTVVGIIGASMLLHNFTMHRTTHLAHHANLNDPEKDADHWVAGHSWWSITLRCMTLVGSHYVMGFRLNGPKVIARAMVENLLPVIALLVAGTQYGWNIMLFAMLIPALLGATLLGFFFDYAVHAPYEAKGRFSATRMFLFPKRLRRIGSALWMAQNYHLIHHLYPWLPFYRYARAYSATRPLIDARQALVIHLFSSDKYDRRPA
jgi:beta-carotene hydroxylase